MIKQLLLVLLLCRLPADPVQDIPWESSGTFQPSVQRIAFDRPPGLYRDGDPVKVTLTDNSEIRVFDRWGKKVYAGVPLARAWPAGYYYVESRTDRSSFAVLPGGTSRLPDLGGDFDVETGDYGKNAAAAGTGWMREFVYWNTITSADMTWGQYDFSALDQVMQECQRTKRKLFVQLSFWPRYLKNPEDKTVARYAQYVADVCSHIAANPNGRAVRAVTLANEPTAEGNNLQFVVPDARQAEQLGWKGAWKGDYTQFLAETYKTCAPVIRRKLPWVDVVGGNNMDFGQAFFMLERIRKEGGLVPEVTALGHHIYDEIGRVDEPIFNGLTLDQKLARLRGYLKPGSTLYIDEYGVYGSRRKERIVEDVLGFPYRGEGTDAVDLAGNVCASWFDGYCDELKKAVILRKHGAVVIGHNSFRGSHDPATWNGLYDGWFPGSAAGLRGPRPGLAGFLAANHWLAGAAFVKDMAAREVLLYEFKRPDGSPIVFAWRRRGQQSPLAKSALLKRTDVFGTDDARPFVSSEAALFQWAGPADPGGLLQAVVATLH